MIKTDRKFVSHNAQIVSIKKRDHLGFCVRYCVDTKQGLIYSERVLWAEDELQAYVEFEKLRMGANGETPNEKET
jgi:hypothetical protein